MPLIKTGTGKFPEWSEIDRIRFIRNNNENSTIELLSPECAFFVSEGKCRLIFEDKVISVSKGESYLFSHIKYFNINGNSECVLIEGTWGKEIGNSGFFIINNSPVPKNTGDPTEYPRMTDFDNHFHDFDEVWVITRGKGIAVSEGMHYEFEKGDCILTRKGDHHDLPVVNEEVHGIYFETTLRGEKRLGHLWNHTHKAPPENKGLQ
jgi:mannose-6-phosphate isomerase-like protein (cupin superfamily)